MQTVDIKNKKFKKLLVCGALGIGAAGMILSGNAFHKENKGKDPISITNRPHGQENDVDGNALMFAVSTIISGASAFQLRKMTKEGR